MPLDLDKGFFTGSGSILANGHLILTNKHVVEDVDYIVVRNGLGETRIAESFVVSETDDLALIKLTQPFPVNTAFTFRLSAGSNRSRCFRNGISNGIYIRNVSPLHNGWNCNK